MAKKVAKKTANELFDRIMNDLSILSKVLEDENKLKAKITHLENCIEILNSPKSMGQRFFEFNKGEHLIAVAQDNHAVLVNCNTGRRWSQPVKVKDLKNITPQEWKEISVGGQFVAELHNLNN